MVADSFTLAGRITDVVIPPSASLRLRTLMLRKRPRWRHYAPPAILSALVPPGCVAVDVGAHRGLWAYQMSRRAATVHAFEPNPPLFSYLARTHIHSMQAHDVALSDRDGSAELFMPEGRGTGRATIAATTGHDIATVKTRRLDSFEFTNVGFVKIDVEGHEEAVLRGAERTLKDTLPTLVIEIEERHNPGAIARIPKALADIGYAQSYFLSGEELLPLADFDVETHQLKIGSAIDPLYVNNFLFASKPVVP